MPLTCGKCPVSSDYPRNGERWCDSKRMEVSVISPCYFATVEDMIHARDWYVDLARRLTKAIAMREAGGHDAQVR